MENWVGPARQRSLRDRLRQGIASSLPWHDEATINLASIASIAVPCILCILFGFCAETLGVHYLLFTAIVFACTVTWGSSSSEIVRVKGSLAKKVGHNGPLVRLLSVKILALNRTNGISDTDCHTKLANNDRRRRLWQTFVGPPLLQWADRFSSSLTSEMLILCYCRFTFHVDASAMTAVRANPDEQTPTLTIEPTEPQPGPSKRQRSRRSSGVDLPAGLPPSSGGRRASEINIPHIPFFRNKSRSVDHGTTAPFDLESLRSKVEGRFQSLDRLSRNDTDGESGSRESLVERKMQPSIPVETTKYKVEATDTLTSVAARFDTTPSELCKLNRLASRTVFPGQVIRVPVKSPKSDKAEGEEDAGDRVSQSASTERSENTDEEDMLETLRVNSPKPGHNERVGTPSSPHLEKFLRINVRHITDGQGVVYGVLIVTPNAFMFDPNVSDPLVIERGPESYGVIAPMDYVVNAAIYHDIAHMRVANAENKFNMPKPEVYHMKSEESEGEGDASVLLSTTDQGDSRADCSAKETLQDLRSSTEDDDALWFSGTQREGDAFPKAFERELVTPTNSTIDKLSDTQDTTADDKSPLNDDEDLNRTEDSNKVEEASAVEDTSRVDTEALIRATEERRKSVLDQHWAVPKHSIDQEKDEPQQEPDPPVLEERRRDSEVHLVKLSCHDSGIDIRDPPPPAPTQRKTVYSDADILLAGDGEFLPPVPVVPLPPAPSSADDEKKKQSVSFSLDDEPKAREDDKQETKKSKMIKRLSYPLSWVEGITGSEDKDSLPSSADSHPSSHTPSSVFSKVLFMSSPINMVTDFGSGLFMKTPSEDGGKFPFPPSSDSLPSSAPSSTSGFSPSNIIGSVGRASVGNPTFNKPKLDYRSMVSVEDMPELFVPFDKLIPRPARSCEDPPLYLRLRMGKPKDRKIPKSSTIMSYGKKKMRPEYWFSVPRERVDELYKFLTSWVGHLYGDLDEVIIAARGYELIDSDTELFDSDDATADGRRSSDGEIDVNIAKESWELLSMSGELRRTLYASSGTSLDLEAFIPDLRGVTEILTEEHRKQLSRHLPARAEGYTWTLVFSTSQHGFSLNSLYRKMANVHSPILMVIEDTQNNVFGALTSCSLQISDHFYGTGESFLYRFAPDLKIYKWTGENTYHIKGDNEALCIGAGDGKFGLWLDGDLNVGRSESCSTYNNEPLSSNLNFTIKTLECWAFM